MWDDVTFRYVASCARTVALIGDFTQWRQHPIMMVREGETFTTTLALPDGRYRYRFVVDGHEGLDPAQPSQLSLTPYGVASLLQVQRWQRMLQITNQTSRPLTISIASSHTWLQATPTSLTLHAQHTGDITLAPQRHLMAAGLNRAGVTVKPPLQRDQVTCAIQAQLDTTGFLIRPQTCLLDLGTCVRGTCIDLEIPCEVHGQGTTEILLYNHGDAMLHHRIVQRVAGQTGGIERLTIPFNLGALPRVERGMCRVTLDTQGHLRNRRWHTVTVHYQLLFLRKNPPRLHFRRFLHNGTQCLTLRLTRSDGVRPQIALEVPAILAQGLETTQLADDTWQLLVRRDAFAGSPQLDQMITLTDRLSGCRDHIRTLIDANI
jgi:hypothetical protein